MRVVSLVPSWTETLISAGVNVVGRTRFCIHPDNKVNSIPIVGGTKNLKSKEILELKPDLIILDKEENPKEFVEQIGDVRWWASHIKSVDDMSNQLLELNQILKNQNIEKMARRWRNIEQRVMPGKGDLMQIPGVLEWIRKPTDSVHKIKYVIWKDPLMIVDRDTFIGSVFTKLGFGEFLEAFKTPYPQIEFSDLDPTNDLLLFSSEPFPFLKEKEWISSLGVSSALIDGEPFSWFGIRSLEFLESLFPE